DPRGDPRSQRDAGLREATMHPLQKLSSASPLPSPLSSKHPSSRRSFLKGSAAFAGALVIATRIDLGGGIAPAATTKDGPMPNAFVRIGADDSVTVLIKHLDKGQGVTTGLSTIVAEELDADWSQVRAEFAPADANLYNNLFFGPVQGTGGSTSTANSWLQLRKAGAAPRAMLVAAAAAEWQGPARKRPRRRRVSSHRPGQPRPARQRPPHVA